MIDALNADGQVVRKRKYRREDSKIQTWWYDYTARPISDAAEVARVEALCTTHTKVDEGFEENALFMQSVNVVSDVSGLPMDKHNIEVLWAPNGTQGELSFALEKGLDGDSYAIIVNNAGDHPATLYLPRVADTRVYAGNVAEGEAYNAGTTFILLDPGATALCSASYSDGHWDWSMERASAHETVWSHIVPEADYLVCRFNYDREAGDGLDTAVAVSGSGISALDGKAAGYGQDNTATGYIEWIGENTGSGKESFVVKLGAIRAALQDGADSVYVKGYASWFASVGDGRVTMEMWAYKGGELSAESGIFIVDDGEVVWHDEVDLCVKAKGEAADYAATYTPIFMAALSYGDVETGVTAGDSVVQKELYLSIVEEINAINVKIESINEQIEGMGDGLKDDIEEIENTISSIQQSITNINTTISGMDTDITNIENSITQISGTITNIQQSISTIQEDITDIRGTVEGHTESITQIQEDLSGLKDTVEGHTESITQIQEDLSGLKETVEGHTEQISSINESIKSLEECCDSNKELIEGMNGTLESLGGTVDSLKETVDGHTTEIEDINGKIDEINAALGDLSDNETVRQALAITLDSAPTSSTLTYENDEGETVDFVQGAFARVMDGGGNYVFYKLANLSGGTATWVKMYDTRWGDVTLETTYSGNYEWANVTSGTTLSGISSESENVKVVNSTGSSIRVVFDAGVSGSSSLVSTLAVSEFTLYAGASAEFTKVSSSEYRLTQLYGVTMFPDLANADREGEWALTVSSSGQPILMEITEIRKWDESITTEQTTDTLNELYPDVPQGFAVVAKTIGKIYEKANQYNMWVAVDCVDV